MKHKLMKIIVGFIIPLCFLLVNINAQETVLSETSQWKNIDNYIPSATLDIRYATTNNFTETQIYNCSACYLRKKAAVALKKVATSLAEVGFTLILYDCYRPAPYQAKLWEVVPNPNYVAPPSKGSVHSRGLAVDLSILDENGEPLKMGTGYDYFGEKGHHDFKNLPEVVLKNRKLLKEVMKKYGFSPIRTEWWHYNYSANAPQADVIWECDKGE